MKSNTSLLLLGTILLLTWRWNLANGKRILFVTPTPMYSHQITYRTLWKELNQRGHELVIVTPYAKNVPDLKNCTIISCTTFDEIDDLKFPDISKRLAPTDTRQNISFLSHFLSEKLLELPEFRKLYVPESNEKFDAVIVETLFSPIFFILGQRFDAPLIGLLSMQLHNTDRYFIGSPIIPSHLSNWETVEITENPTFWERLRYFIETWYDMYDWIYNFIPTQQSIARKYFGDNVPDILEAGKNISLYIANSHALNLYARPDVPTVIYYNSGHISEQPPPLPTDLREFLDNATDGFIYISLGSTLRYEYLADKIKTLFLNVFSKLPWRIVWKRDDAKAIKQLSYHPSQIYISNWVPQQGILAHPNIKLFIYQGGLQSSEEAMHYGVPLLGIPIMFDQEYNVIRMESLGIAKHLPLATLTETKLYNAACEMIQDKSYKKKMTEIHGLLNDTPYDTLEHAIWWIEYIIRTRGAPHLQFSEKNKPLYQQYNIDVIVFLVMVMNFILICFLILIFIFSWYAITRSPLTYLVQLLKKEKEKIH